MPVLCLQVDTLPVSDNHLYKPGRMKNQKFLAPRAKMFRDALGLLAKSEMMRKQLDMTYCSVRVVINYYFPDKKRRDVANYDKLVLDAFIGIVYLDDVQVDQVAFTKFYSKKQPSTEIEIRWSNGEKSEWLGWRDNPETGRDNTQRPVRKQSEGSTKRQSTSKAGVGGEPHKGNRSLRRKDIQENNPEQKPDIQKVKRRRLQQPGARNSGAGGSASGMEK